MYDRLKFYKPIDGCKTIKELREKGCPKCGRKLFAEGSVRFGSLHCKEHRCVWLFVPSKRGEKDGYASKSWKNMLTGEMSAEFKRRKVRNWR